MDYPFISGSHVLRGREGIWSRSEQGKQESEELFHQERTVWHSYGEEEPQGSHMGSAGSTEDWWMTSVSGALCDICERVAGAWLYGFLSLPEWSYEAESRGGEIGQADSVRPAPSSCDFIHQGAQPVPSTQRTGTGCWQLWDAQGFSTCSRRIMGITDFGGKKWRDSTYFSQKSVWLFKCNHWRNDSDIKVLSIFGSASVLRITSCQNDFSSVTGGHYKDCFPEATNDFK